jgi:hypothetical protein
MFAHRNTVCHSLRYIFDANAVPSFELLNTREKVTQPKASFLKNAEEMKSRAWLNMPLTEENSAAGKTREGMKSAFERIWSNNNPNVMTTELVR